MCLRGSHCERVCAEEWTARRVTKLFMAQPPYKTVHRDTVVLRCHPELSKLVNQPTCRLPEAKLALGVRKLHKTSLYYMDRTNVCSHILTV